MYAAYPLVRRRDFLVSQKPEVIGANVIALRCMRRPEQVLDAQLFSHSYRRRC